MSTTYCKTKMGKIFKVWSDNVEEETMHVYPHDEIFDAESINPTVLKYTEIEKTDTNLAVLQ